MRAWRVHELGEPADVLRLDNVAPTEPGAGEVAIEVSACALNFPDVLLCRGEYQEKPPLPFTPGLELGGGVVGPASGCSVRRRLPGRFAEQALLARDRGLPVPDGSRARRPPSLHVTYQTGHVGLYRRAQLQPGETLLVHAGAGGVGRPPSSSAGRRRQGDRHRRRAEKVAVCRELGADLAVDYLAEDFVAVVKEATGGRGADVIYDPVGGDIFDRSRKCIAFEGRLLVIGFAGGRFADAPANHVLVKNYSVVGLHWGLYRNSTPPCSHAATTS